MTNPIIQCRRGTLANLKAGRALYAGEIAVTTDGKTNTDNIVFVGTSEDANEGSGSAAHFGYGNIALISGTTLTSNGITSYSINRLGTISNSNGTIQFDATIDEYTILGGSSPNSGVPSFRQRPILIGPTSDFMSYEKKDEVALKSDLSPYLTAAQAAHAAMPATPASSGTNIEVGANGTTYTAPTDGYFYAHISGSNVAVGDFIELGMSSGNAAVAGRTVKVFSPAATGQSFILYYRFGGGKPVLRFIKCMGAQ